MRAEQKKTSHVIGPCEVSQGYSDRREPEEHSRNLPYGQGAVVYDPAESEKPNSEHPWVGNRRAALAPADALPWRWPGENATAKQRYESFEAWHRIAMQILDKAGGSFRLMAIFKNVIHWKSGEIRTPDADLALHAGNCSIRTVSRDVGHYRKTGVITVEKGWRKVDGSWLRSRTIRLAVPVLIPPGLIIDDGSVHIDTRGLDGEGAHLATRGPSSELATRGLITTDTTEDGGRRNVSA